VATLPPNTTSYRDIVQSNTLYFYYVIAYLDVGSSSSSNTVTAFAPTNPPTTPPAAPTIWLAVPYPFQIVVEWFDNSDNEFGFKLERCDAIVCDDAAFTVIATLSTKAELSYVVGDPNVVPGRTYTYRVRAFNSVGDSPSSEASSTSCYVDVDAGFYYCLPPQ